MTLVSNKLLLGHSIGLDKSYWKPQVNDLLQEYLKCVDVLTIRRQIQTLNNNKSKIEKLKGELELYKKDLIDQLRREIEYSNKVAAENQKLKGIDINDLKYSEDIKRLFYPC